MKLAAALALACVFGCAPPTPAQEASAVKAAIDAGRAGCVIASVKSIDLTPAQRAWCDR